MPVGTSSKSGLIIAGRPLCSPIMPSTVSTVPGWMPAIHRLPRKTTTRPPLSSRTTHSTVGVPAHGCTRRERTRPLTRARSRQRTSAIGISGCAGALVVMAHSSRAISEVIRDEGHVGVGQPGYGAGDAVGRPVVEQAVPGAAVLATRDQHADFGLAVTERLGHDLEDGARDAPVGAVDQLEGEAREPEPAPLLCELLSVLEVVGDMNGAQ